MPVVVRGCGGNRPTPFVSRYEENAAARFWRASCIQEDAQQTAEAALVVLPARTPHARIAVRHRRAFGLRSPANALRNSGVLHRRKLNLQQVSQLPVRRDEQSMPAAATLVGAEPMPPTRNPRGRAASGAQKKICCTGPIVLFT